MTGVELIQRLQRHNCSLEILIRAEWEDLRPNGNIFQPVAIVEDIDHATGDPFLALECDQQGEEDKT